MIPHSRPTLGEDEIKAVSEVIRSGMLAQGEEVSAFEEKMCQFIGTTYAAATCNGSAALFLLLKALNIGPGDEVALPAYVCTAPLNCIYQIGAKPLVVDIEIASFNISVQDLLKKLTKKTKAIIIPHMFGQSAELEPILNIGLPVIEDCAMSLGAIYKGKMTGSFGIASIFSFYATKVITTGEGGMVLSNSADIISKIKDLRSYDERNEYTLRFNCKMSDLQAAIGQIQLTRLPQFIARRQEIAAIYNRKFSSLKIKLPHEFPNRKSIFYRYVVLCNNGVDELIKTLGQNGIIARRPIFKPLNLYLKLSGFSQTDKAYREALSLPLYPSLNKKEIATIINGVKDAIT